MHSDVAVCFVVSVQGEHANVGPTVKHGVAWLQLDNLRRVQVILENLFIQPIGFTLVPLPNLHAIGERDLCKKRAVAQAHSHHMSPALLTPQTAPGAPSHLGSRLPTHALMRHHKRHNHGVPDFFLGRSRRM